MRTVRRALRAPFAARTWRELLYSLLSLPLAVLGVAADLLAVLVGLFSAGLLVLPGLPLILGLVRALGWMYRGLARTLLRLDIAEPPRQPRRPGFLGVMVFHLADPVAWRAAGYLAIRFPLGLVQFVLGFGWWVYSMFLALYPLLWRIQQLTSHPVRGPGRHAGLWLYGHHFGSWFEGVFVSGFGLLCLLAWPWVQRAPLALDRWLMPRLLGPSETSLRLVQLTETREHAINEAAETLRRIERDLHDGAQARMIALGMRLGRVESRLGKGDTEQALRLLRESREETREIVQELRELVRGIHPPALDAGLEPALATLAARSPLPTTVRVELPRRPPAGLETMLYFATAELLTNAAKHSGASSVAVTVLSVGSDLRLLVTDDGRGGATLDGAGSGLRGLAERVRTADGRLGVDSPPGGPTTVSIQLEGR
jgi:signal transduction histidine kinase